MDTYLYQGCDEIQNLLQNLLELNKKELFSIHEIFVKKTFYAGTLQTNYSIEYISILETTNLYEFCRLFSLGLFLRQIKFFLLS